MHTNKDIGKRARIIQDCRKGGNATGTYGIYEGDLPISAVVWLADETWHEYYYQPFIEGKVMINGVPGNTIPELRALATKARELAKQTGQEYQPPEPPYWFPDDNPCIRLEDGSVIWGYQCWWDIVDEGEPEQPLEQAQAEVGRFIQGVQIIAEEIHKAREQNLEGV